MDKDIQEMFRQKNKEILIHNLELDIERNINVLKDTLTNIYNLQFDIASKNILSIYDDKISNVEIAKVLVPLKSKSFIILDKYIDEKEMLLLEKLKSLEFVEDKMEEYYKLVFSTTDGVVTYFKDNELLELLKTATVKFSKYSKDISNDNREIIDSRVYDYIHIRLFGKLEEKLKQEFLIRDNNLSNKGRESYIKFQELEMRTTKI